MSPLEKQIADAIRALVCSQNTLREVADKLQGILLTLRQAREVMSNAHDDEVSPVPGDTAAH